MPERADPRNLHRASDGTVRDYEGSIYNENGYLLEKSPDRIARETQSQSFDDYIAQDVEMFNDAANKAGGMFYVPKPKVNLGFAGIFLIGFFVLSFLMGLLLFLGSPDGDRLLRNIGNFFSEVGFHIAAFLFAWPQTFQELFDHWFYLPELLIALFMIYYLIKTADDNDFYREDGFKCIAPFLLIEGIRAIFLRDPFFTRLACILRAFGLGLGLCIVVWILKKILVRR